MMRSLFTLILLGGLGGAVFGQVSSVASTNTDSPTTAASREIEIAGITALIPDVVVVDHEGRRRRLYSDMIKDKVVLMHFFYTRCSYMCSLQGQDLNSVQNLLGSRQGRDVFLISISMDPGHDNPRQLRRWAKIFGVKRGWSLVSGNSVEIRKLLKTLTGNSGPVEMHAAPVFIGDDKARIWTALDGLSGAGNLTKAIELVSGNSANNE